MITDTDRLFPAFCRLSREKGGACVADRILIVDNDPAMGSLLQKVMRSNDMEAQVMGSGAEALQAIPGGNYSLMLLEILLEDMDGFDLISALRSQGCILPIIIVSSRSEDYDILYGLSIGADDYVTKPFHSQILAAKVKALIRRTRQFLQENAQGSQLTCGPFVYDAMTMRFYKRGMELILSAKERSMLLLFIKHPQQVFTKDMIYEQVWGNTVAVDDNAIMVYVNRLRSKIEDNVRSPRHIVTIRGLGYRFVP